MSRAGLLAAALAAVLLTAGCTAIPTSGTVQVPPAAGPNDPVEPELVSVPNPPQPGADQQHIVQGFVLAASAGGDYEVAKQFLTRDAARRWRPAERVLVHDQSWTTVQRPENRVELRVPAVAEVGTDGTYTPSVDRRALGYRLVRQGGQWRIADVPDGVVLSSNSFQSHFRPLSLTFFDPTFTRPVPDRRWFPTSGPGSGTAAVLRRLIAGQAPQLAPGVTATAFPASTRLVGVGPTEDGVTTVSIRTGARQSAVATTRMQQQIARSLPKASTGSVRLVVNGVLAPSAKPLAAAGSITSPVVLADGRFGSLDDRGVTEDAVLGKRIEAIRPTAVTVSSRQRLAALRTGAGAAVVTSSGARTVDRREDLAAPTLDQTGWMYSVPRSEPSELLATRSSGPSLPVPGIQSGGTLRTIEASPEGTRMLVLLDTASGPACFVAGIERDADGTPIGLADQHYQVVLAPGAVASTATWVDEDSVAVLTSGSDGQDNVVQQQLGGVTGSLGRPPSTASALAGGGSVDDLLVRTADGGGLYRSVRNTVWQSALGRPVQVSVLAVQR